VLWSSIADWLKASSLTVLLLVASAAAQAASSDPLLSSRFMDIAYPNRQAFIKDLLRQRRPSELNTPSETFQDPVVSALEWQHRDAVVLTQQARLSGRTYHFVVFIFGSDSRPLYRSRRYSIECRLAGYYARQQAIDACKRQQQRR